MKKILTLTLALFLVLSLVACDVSTNDEIKKPSNVEIGDTGETGTNGGSTESVENNGTNSEDTENTNNNNQPSKTEVTIEQTVLLDESGVKIIAKSINMDSLFGPEIKLYIENNSGKDLTIQCRNVSVNGYMVDAMMSVDIVNGKKANDSLTFMSSDLESCGITDIADIELSFHIFTTSDWEDYLDTDQIQLKTSIADNYQYIFDDSGDIAYNANGIKVIIKGLSENASIFGPSIVVYIENNTNKAITVQSRDVSINSFMVDAMFSCEVMPSKKAVDTITFLESDLEKNEITNIDNLELYFHIFDAESWDDIVDTDVVKITFN